LEERESRGESLLVPPPQSSSPQEVPTTAFALALVAGVLFLLGASMPLIFMGSFGKMGGMMEDYEGGEMMEGFDGGEMMDTGFIVTRIVGLAFAGAVLYGAIMLNSRPAQHVTWGTLILVFSILSVFTSWAGFGIGLILGVIGGGLAISWRPAAVMSPTAPTGRFCSDCGRAIAVDAMFCAYCGHQLPA
jgi:hypothetical protein